MKPRRKAAVWCLCLWLIAGSGLAHRGHDTLSVVEIDAASGAVTVTHHFTAHDVEPVLPAIAPDASPSVDDPAAMAALQAYVLRRFTLADADGPVTLRFVDAILSGNDVRLVYQGQLPPPARQLTASAQLFTEYYPGAENQVNLRRAGVTRTLRFRDSAQAQEIVFD